MVVTYPPTAPLDPLPQALSICTTTGQPTAQQPPSSIIMPPLQPRRHLSSSRSYIVKPPRPPITGREVTPTTPPASPPHLPPPSPAAWSLDSLATAHLLVDSLTGRLRGGVGILRAVRAFLTCPGTSFRRGTTSPPSAVLPTMPRTSTIIPLLMMEVVGGIVRPLPNDRSR